MAKLSAIRLFERVLLIKEVYIMRYYDYNGSRVDYDLDNPVLDNGRSARKAWGQLPDWALSDDYTGDYEPELFDPDIDWDR